jgi:hypothetical protein
MFRLILQILTTIDLLDEYNEFDSSPRNDDIDHDNDDIHANLIRTYGRNPVQTSRNNYRPNIRKAIRIQPPRIALHSPVPDCSIPPAAQHPPTSANNL